MSPPLDDGVEKLQAFCDLLEATNPTLESGAADLLRLAQGLNASESRLSTELHALDSDVDGVQKEAESSEAATVKACQELGAAAEEEVKTELPEIDGQADAAKEEWAREIDQRATALSTAFQELDSKGWGPLDTALESERRDFERWMNEADAALNGVSNAIEGAGQEVQEDAGECATAATDWTSAPSFDNAFWEPANLQAEKVDSAVVQSFRTQRLQVSQTLGQSYEDLTRLMETEAQEVQDVAEAKAESLATEIRDEADRATQAVDKTASALEAAKVEFETSAIHADGAEPVAAELAELARKIEAAEVQLDELRASMEAMGS